MTIITRSRDYQAIRALVTDPAIFPFVSDDFVPTPAEWSPIENEQLVYLLASDDEGYFGFAAFFPENWICWRAHLGFLPRSYGAVAASAFQQMLAWMWQNTSARRLKGEIAQENRKAIQFAVNAGFEVYGVNRASLLKGGELRDQVALGISKP